MADKVALNSDASKEFHKRTLELINDLLILTDAAFYLVDPSMNHMGVVLGNAQGELGKNYHKTYRTLDPLDPYKFHHTDDKLVTIDSILPFERLRQTIYYQDFMKPKGHRYVADMLFRQQGEVIAVISCLRNEALGQYTGDELLLLEKLQPYLEFTLNGMYLPDRVKERQSIRDKYQLTKRELDVLELLVSGGQNKAIATKLGLCASTVKSHLLNIYKKTGVSSRAELISKTITDIGYNS